MSVFVVAVKVKLKNYFQQEMHRGWIGSLSFMSSESILPIRRIRKLRRAPETPGGPLALKYVFILASFLSLASGYENMNDHLF